MYKILFKKQGLSLEWAQLILKNPKLVHIVLDYCKEMGESALLTEIFRTDEMQLSYYPNQPKLKSVHQYWRGVDISIKDLDRKKVDKAVAKVNARFVYGKVGLLSLKVHDVGHGLHLHCQTIDCTA
jgi:hypothetical protein